MEPLLDDAKTPGVGTTTSVLNPYSECLSRAFRQWVDNRPYHQAPPLSLPPPLNVQVRLQAIYLTVHVLVTPSTCRPCTPAFSTSIQKLFLGGVWAMFQIFCLECQLVFRTKQPQYPAVSDVWEFCPFLSSSPAWFWGNIPWLDVCVRFSMLRTIYI